MYMFPFWYSVGKLALAWGLFTHAQAPLVFVVRLASNGRLSRMDSAPPVVCHQSVMNRVRSCRQQQQYLYASYGSKSHKSPRSCSGNVSLMTHYSW